MNLDLNGLNKSEEKRSSKPGIYLQTKLE